MAIEDIISEEIETRAPNLEVAQGSPDDFMTEDEMDPMQDPELQQLLESLPGEQAEVLMQLIKEFKAMVAQGFEGEFEDFVKMKMSTAQGGSEEDFMSEEEMIIPDEEIQSMVPMGEQAAHGGRIGYQQGGGGIMDVAVEEQVETGPTSQQVIMEWLRARGLPITPENIQKAILEMSREGQAPARQPHTDMPPMEQPRPPTGADYIPEELIGQDMTETVTPAVAQMFPHERPEKEIDIYDYSDEEMEEIKQRFIESGGDPSVIDKITRGEVAQGGRIGYQNGNQVTADAPGVRSQVSPSRVNQIQGNQMAEDAMQEIIRKFYERFPRLMDMEQNITLTDMVAMLQAEGIIENTELDQGILGFDKSMGMITPASAEKSAQRISMGDTAWGDVPEEMMAQGGRPGYQYGNQVTADAPGVRSQVSPERQYQIEGNQMAEDAMDKIYMEFRQRFPEASEEDIQQMIRNYVAEEQFEGVLETEGAGILDIHEGAKMITPESVDRSAQAMSRHHWQEGGRARYGLGSLVKGIFKGAKKGVKSLVKSVKKFAKSDLGKAALLYIATAGMGNIMQPGAASWASPFTKGAGTGWLRPGTVLSNYGNLFNKSTPIKEAAGKLTSGNQYSPIANMGYNKNLSTMAPKITADKGGLFSKALGSFKNNPMPWILGTSGAAGLYTAKNPGEENLDNFMGGYKGEVSDWDKIFADIRSGKKSTAFSTENIDYPYPNYMNLAAEGGRIGRAEGGLMDLGGMEKDYRAEGGFVPIGGKEKADDVPARLSRNEFVFTADAVRNAGGGDVDKGSEVMENVMTNLEQGGSISEESQGLEGARDMFEVSERLSEVV